MARDQLGEAEHRRAPGQAQERSDRTAQQTCNRPGSFGQLPGGAGGRRILGKRRNITDWHTSMEPEVAVF